MYCAVEHAKMYLDVTLNLLLIFINAHRDNVLVTFNLNAAPSKAENLQDLLDKVSDFEKVLMGERAVVDSVGAYIIFMLPLHFFCVINALTFSNWSEWASIVHVSVSYRSKFIFVTSARLS